VPFQFVPSKASITIVPVQVPVTVNATVPLPDEEIAVLPEVVMLPEAVVSLLVVGSATPPIMP